MNGMKAQKYGSLLFDPDDCLSVPVDEALDIPEFYATHRGTPAKEVGEVER